MTRMQERRLTRLENVTGSSGIPVWIDDPVDVPAEIDRMTAAGEISDADRLRCNHWVSVTRCAGEHERALADLDQGA